MSIMKKKIYICICTGNIIQTLPFEVRNQKSLNRALSQCHAHFFPNLIDVLALIKVLGGHFDHDLSIFKQFLYLLNHF